MRKRHAARPRRTATVEVEGQRFEIAICPLSLDQNIVLAACYLKMQALQSEGIGDAECEAEALAAEDASALDLVWGHVHGDRASLRARLREIQDLLLKHFVLDHARALALPRATRYKLIVTTLTRGESSRTGTPPNAPTGNPASRGDHRKGNLKSVSALQSLFWVRGNPTVEGRYRDAQVEGDIAWCDA